MQTSCAGNTITQKNYKPIIDEKDKRMIEIKEELKNQLINDISEYPSDKLHYKKKKRTKEQNKKYNKKKRNLFDSMPNEFILHSIKISNPVKLRNTSKRLV